MATWKKVLFVSVLITFIGLSVFFSFYAIARDTFEFKSETDIGGVDGLNGWVLYGFNGNTATKTISIDYVRDKKGNNPDETKPVTAVSDFTIVSDEYVEFINIGESVKFIDEKAFFYCKSLKAVFVDENNPNYCSVDGVLYSKDKTELLLRPSLNGDWQVEQGLTDSADTFAIPEGVTRVDGYSFYKNEHLVHLTFPSTLKEIGDMAFFGCGGMWSVWLPEGLESIGNDAFSYCGSLCPIMYIPKTVTHIGHHAFFSCSGLTVFYMGAENDENIELGADWLPKSVKGGIVNKAPDPQYGKTLQQAMVEKDRIDAENAAKEGK